MRHVWGLLVLGVLLGSGTLSSANAGQDATVVVESLEVHEHPTSKSPLLKTLTQGTTVRVSFNRVTDEFGVYWLKVRIEPGKLGYAEADGFRTEDITRDLKGGGISRKEVEVDDEDSPWLMALRAMGLGGVGLTSGRAQFGGEFELSVCIPMERHGYLHRLLALGPVFMVLSDDSVLGASLIFRIYNKGSLLEPEVRIRGGLGTLTNSLYAGVNFGVSYPLSMNAGNHLAVYAELGSLTTLSFNSITLWGAAGIGFHF